MVSHSPIFFHQFVCFNGIFVQVIEQHLRRLDATLPIFLK